MMLVVSGAPGAGKTSVGRRVAARLDALLSHGGDDVRVERIRSRPPPRDEGATNDIVVWAAWHHVPVEARVATLVRWIEEARTDPPLTREGRWWTDGPGEAQRG